MAIPEGWHEVTCAHCNSTWLCDCSGETYLGGRHVAHQFSEGRLHYCPVCRPRYDRESKWDASYDPQDSSDIACWPDAAAAWRYRG